MQLYSDVTKTLRRRAAKKLEERKRKRREEARARMTSEYDDTTTLDLTDNTSIASHHHLTREREQVVDNRRIYRDPSNSPRDAHANQPHTHEQHAQSMSRTESLPTYKDYVEVKHFYTLITGCMH